MTDQGNSAAAVQNEIAGRCAKRGAKQRKDETLLDKPTCLYRHYSAKRQLLYIGISLSALERTMGHRYKADWYMQIARITLEWFPSKRAALDAEREQIRIYRPKFNVMHSKAHMRLVDRVIARDAERARLGL